MRELLSFQPGRRTPPAAADCRGRALDFTRVRIMGVLNVTPDSFSDGGKFFDLSRALEAVARMAEEGADIIDIGGESTRPGSLPVDEAGELRRVMPVLERLDPSKGPLLSIDTRKPGVARAAFGAGAHILNDVGGLADPAMRESAARAGAPAVAMHMRGEPRTMQEKPVYGDVVREVAACLEGRAREAEGAGVPSVWIDPGIGFGKTFDHNLAILRGLAVFLELRRPLVIGVSRKAFVGAITGVQRAEERLVGTKVAEAFAAFSGADVIRTHDVRAAAEALQMAGALARGRVAERPAAEAGPVDTGGPRP
ncbi:MAG: dihydropteroate synthase [Nitrospinota bacterium]